MDFCASLLLPVVVVVMLAAMVVAKKQLTWRRGAAAVRGVVVGYVEPCHHPAVIGGLCAVCGSRVDRKGHATAAGAASASSLGPKYGKRSSTTMVDASPSSSSAATTGSSINPTRRGGTKTSHLTVSGGLTISISQSEAESIASDSSARLRSGRKLSLVLDLDHTLLHATADPRADAYVARSGLWVDDDA